MKITLHHPAAADGVPVILDDHDQLMPMAEGFKAACRRLGWENATEIGERLGIMPRTVFAYNQGTVRVPNPQVLNRLMLAMEVRNAGDPIIHRDALVCAKESEKP